MRLSVVFICASILVFTAESRGGKGGKRGSSGHGKRGNKKVEHSDAVPAWTKYCETLENWADKPGKEKLVKRCKCYNAKKSGEQVSTDCEHSIAGHKTDSVHKPPASIFERLCAKAEAGSELEKKCKCRVILDAKGRTNDKEKRLCKQKMDGKRQLVKACRQLKTDLKGMKPESYTVHDKALKQKCEKLSNAAKEKMRGFASERRDRIMKCKRLMAQGKENLPRDDLQFMRKNCPHGEQSELHG